MVSYISTPITRLPWSLTCSPTKKKKHMDIRNLIKHAVLRKTNLSWQGFDSSTFSVRKKKVIAKEKIHYPALKFHRLPQVRPLWRWRVTSHISWGTGSVRKQRWPSHQRESEIMDWSYCISYKQKTDLIRALVFHCGACMALFVDRLFWWDQGSPTSSRKWPGHPCVPWHTPESRHTPCRCMYSVAVPVHSPCMARLWGHSLLHWGKGDACESNLLPQSFGVSEKNDWEWMCIEEMFP